MSDLVINPNCWFSQAHAHIISSTGESMAKESLTHRLDLHVLYLPCKKSYREENKK